MPEVIKLKKGLDICLQGAAEKRIVELPLAESYGVAPSDFKGLTPKLLVREGDTVKAGSALFFDKKNPEILITSPVSGTVEAVRRGEKRKILEVVVASQPEQQYEKFDVGSPSSQSREQIIETLLKSGLWPFIIQRPYGVVANPADSPKAVFISGFDSAPLAPDMDFALRGEENNLRTGIEAMKRLTEGAVYLGLRAGAAGPIAGLENADRRYFSGPHPAGNVGIQINHVAPIAKGDIVWTVNIQDLAIIGRLFNEGRVDMRRVIAVTGSEVVEPCYYKTVACTSFVQLLRGQVRRQEGGGRVRIINGNPLTGTIADPRAHVAFYTNQITLLPEGDKYEFIGWLMPRFNKFSVSRSYFSWLMPRRCYRLDTNINGGHRPFIWSGIFEQYLPMDIYPLQLIKACMAGDIDKMENLGIYEVIEEDLALCEFVDPSKNEIQQAIREGINLMIKELD